jgi:hypothetical protein
MADMKSSTRPLSAMLVIAATALSGCAALAPPVWYKAGSTQNEFSQTRYSCLQESQQHASAAYVNQYTGAAQEQMVTNEQLFAACMNAHGWYLQRPEVASQQEASRQEASREQENTAGYTAFLACLRSAPHPTTSDETAATSDRCKQETGY